MTLMREKTATVTVPVSMGGWVKLNAGQEVPMRVLNSQEMLKRIAVGVKNKSLLPIERVALVNDAYALVKAGHQSPGSLLLLLHNYMEEDEFCVWEGLSEVLKGLDTILSENDEVHSMFQNFAKKLVVNLMKKIGWETSSDDHLTTMLRGIMISLLSTFAYNDELVISEAKTRFAAFQENANDVLSLPSDMRTPVFQIILKNGGEKEYNAIKTYFFSADTSAERKHVLNSLGCTPVPALKHAAMEWSTSGEIKIQDFFYVMGSVGRSNRIGREISWKYFEDNFEKIKSMIANASSSLMDACIVMCAGGFSTYNMADEIDAFFESHPLPSNTRKIAQLTEGMRASAKFLDTLLSSELVNRDFWDNLEG
jgi:aminopeptidase N